MGCITDKDRPTAFPSRKVGRRPGWVDGVDTYFLDHLLDSRILPARVTGVQLADDVVLIYVSSRREMFHGYVDHQTA